jgi:CheY-like chemotaxis protein
MRKLTDSPMTARGPGTERGPNGLRSKRPKAASPSQTADDPPPGPLILLVEDDLDNREMYRQYLEWDGFRVAVATDGGQAVDGAAALVPTAIVTDLALPRLDGWEAIRRIKADDRTKHIPVLALSAHAYAGDVERARAAGCDVFLTKPCLPEDVARAVRSLLKRGAVMRPARAVRRDAPAPGSGTVPRLRRTFPGLDGPRP